MTKSTDRPPRSTRPLALCLMAAVALSACGGGQTEENFSSTEAAALKARENGRDGPDPALAPTPETAAPAPAPAPAPTNAPAPAGTTSIETASFDFAATGYGAPADKGQTDDPLTNAVSYAGQVYYVDCSSGDDSRDGRSPTTAWRTVAQVNTKTRVGYWDTVEPNSSTNPPFHEPWTAAPSGSAFLFKRGCAFDGFINVHAATIVGTVSTYSQNFTFGAYGNGSLPRPKISYITPSTMFKGMVWSNGHTVHLRNLHLVSNPAVSGVGVWFRASNSSSIDNTVIENVYGDGVNADNTVNFVMRNSSVLRTSQSGGRGGGLVGSGTNLQVLNSTFVDNGRDRIGAHNIYVRHLHGALFQGNSLSGGSNLGLVLHGSSEDVVIRGNDIFGNSNGIDITGGYTEAEVFDNITVENNRIRDNGYRLNEQGYGLLLKSLVNSSIHNNLVYGNRLGALNMADANSGDTFTGNVQIFQNLFQDPGTGSGVVFSGAALSKVDVRNNIMVQLSATRTVLSKNPLTPESALTLNNNLYYSAVNTTGRIIQYNGSAITVPQLTAMTNKEAAGRYANPAFVNEGQFDFRVQLASPARKRGAAVGVLRDFAGLSRSAEAPTVGAHE